MKYFYSQKRVFDVKHFLLSPPSLDHLQKPTQLVGEKEKERFMENSLASPHKEKRNQTNFKEKQMD